MAVTANIIVETAAKNTSEILGTYIGRSAISYSRKLRATDVSKLYAATRSATVSDSLDATALTDAYGISIAFTTVKALQIQNKDAANTLTISGNLIGSDVVTIGPGKCLYIDTDRSVDGTHKTLTATPSAGTIAYDVLLIGS